MLSPAGKLYFLRGKHMCKLVCGFGINDADYSVNPRIDGITKSRVTRYPAAALGECYEQFDDL